MDRLIETGSTPQSRYTFKMHTYGCKVNTYDSGLLQQRLQKTGVALPVNSSGTSDSSVGPQVHILNTCAVTGEATKQAIKDARRIRSREPLATIVMTGCAAQVDGAALDHLPGIDLIVANSHKGELERILDQFFKGDREQRVFRSNIFKKEDLEAGGGVEREHTRTFLKIQDGCNSFCSYCVIPYARGKSRSIPIKELTARIRNLVETQGTGEVVLTGVHIGDYLDESRPAGRGDLNALIEAVLKDTKIPRIRLTSLEPVELNDGLFEFYSDDRMCRHFHMSIQSANTSVLRGMKRQYEASHVETALTAIHEKVPGSFVGMDVIVGFPHESDADFQDTYDRLARLPWTRIHVFPYSERPGTKAAALMKEGAVPQHIRALRATKLRELSSERFSQSALEQVGLSKQALILKNSDSGILSGLTRDYWPVVIENAAGDLRAKLAGQETQIRITGYDHSDASRMDGTLRAELKDLKET